MYVNGYILPVAEDQKAAYTTVAEVFTEVALDFGALQAFENWELEVPDGELTDFRRAVRAEPGEKIVLSWVVWPDRETAAVAHKGMFEDPRMTAIDNMPTDSRRIVMGGFTPLVARHAR